VARVLMKIDLVPIILHEQPNKGQTIIEKFESNADSAGCAVVLLTADDVGHARADEGPEEFRAAKT
jgi:predicted nucleotide-binding protein